MQRLIKILGQLNDDERNNLTSWFAKLSHRERENVAMTFSKISIDEVRIILNIPEEQRISLFLVDSSFSPTDRIDTVNTKLKNATDELRQWRLERKAKRNQS